MSQGQRKTNASESSTQQNGCSCLPERRGGGAQSGWTAWSAASRPARQPRADPAPIHQETIYYAKFKMIIN